MDDLLDYARMNILYIFQDEYPWDVRVEKIVNTLSSRHEVTILCRNRGRLSNLEMTGGQRIVRVGGSGLKSATGFPAFFSPWWIHKGLSVIKRFKIDLIIVRDLPLAPLALVLKQQSKLPVVFDMAEDYPGMIRAFWKLRGPTFLDYAIRNPFLLETMEKLVLPRVDETWVVSEASRVRIAGLVNGRVEVVRNTPTADILEYSVGPIKPSSSLALVYTGLVEEDRGLETLLSAVGIVRNKGYQVTLEIVGTGAILDNLKDLARKLKIEHAIRFTGWLETAALREAILRSDIGIVPHHVTQHTNTTLPNKVYDYMAFGKPVIVSDALALRELVNTYRCGLVFEDGDPESLASCLERLENWELRETLGKSGRQSVVEDLNWANDAEVVLASVRRLRSLA